MIFPTEINKFCVNGFQVEFAVQMSGSACAEKLKNTLKDVGTVDIDVPTGRVVINSHLPWVEIQERIEKTGRKTVLSGFGGNNKLFNYQKGTQVYKSFYFRPIGSCNCNRQWTNKRCCSIFRYCRRETYRWLRCWWRNWWT